MFLRVIRASGTTARFPRASGDVPELRGFQHLQKPFSPRERGCSGHRADRR